MLEKYRVMREFLDLPLPEPSDEELVATGHPLVDDFIKLEQAKQYMKEKKYRDTSNLLNRLRSNHPYFRRQKEKLELKLRYFNQDYQGFIRAYPDASSNTLTEQLLLLNCYTKTGNKEKAEALFRKLFAKNNLSPFRRYLSRSTLNGFLKALDYQYWYKKLKFLAGRNRFTEFLREKPYIKAPQMIDLFYAEFYYRRRQYSRCKRILNRVNSPGLRPYKLRMVLKMQIRNDAYENIDTFLEEIKGETDLYLELLMDSASILLNRGEKDLALEIFQRYILTVRQLHYSLAVVHGPEYGEIRDENYWKSLWISAWLYYRADQKDRAAELFQTILHAPATTYRAAARYWLGQLKKRQARKLNIQPIDFPFTYYYTLSEPSPLTDKGTMKSFIQLLNHPTGKEFPEIVENIRTLAGYGKINDASRLIRWTTENIRLNPSDRHTLMLIESILFMKKGNYALAFIRFRDNFECYRCIRLPRFLRAMALPVKYPELVQKYSRLRDLDPYIVFSLIREESYFRRGAVSYANAYGLMQLLLRTARQMAGRGVRLYRRNLFQPETNIRYGTKYLRFLLNKYDDRIHLALAAYNAGDHRVDVWISRFGNVSDEEFVEMIPFSATRSYVKNILRNYYYYRLYYGDAYN